MIFFEWTPVTETNFIPPFGDELFCHLDGYQGAVKNTSCSAWGLLYKVLKDNNLPIGIVAFTKTGKPFFLDSDIQFSISHSKGVCAVSVSDKPVGVDIEPYKSSYNKLLIERSLSEAERTTFCGDFTLLWCRKEAVAKMTGEGIIGYPSSIDTTGYHFYEELIRYNKQKFWFVVVDDATNRCII